MGRKNRMLRIIKFAALILALSSSIVYVHLFNNALEKSTAQGIHTEVSSRTLAQNEKPNGGTSSHEEAQNNNSGEQVHVGTRR